MLLSVPNFAIEHVSTMVSKNRVSIEKRLEGLLPENRISRLKKVNGFESFSIVEENICTSDLCFAAAEKIFSETKTDRSEIRAIIFISQSPDYPLPSTAHILQNRLNLPRDAAAFDVNLGCSGFVYGLYIAASLIQNLPDGKILLLCGDILTEKLFHEDVATLSVFGEAGSATIVTNANVEGHRIYFNLQTFGELSNAIILERGAYRHSPIIKNNSLNCRENFVRMDGAAVMDFSIRYVPQNLSELLEFSKTDLSKVGAFVVHQANKLILQNLAAKMKVDEEKFPFRAAKTGNTSSASIPLALTEMKRLGEATNFLAVLSGFGVGMSIASAVIDLSQTNFLPTGEFS